jgi:hypothetical protein
VTRLPVAAFAALALATVGAFFVTQHLKVTTPLIAGLPRPVPGVIDPYGARCGGVDHSRMRISFYLLHRSDDVDVYIIDSGGTIVRTLASGRHLGIRRRTEFVWNGREDDGTVAPDGNYYVRVALLHQGRTVEITDRAGSPERVKVKSVPPHPLVSAVSPPLIPQGSTPVTIDYRGTEGRSGIIRLYRTDLPGMPLEKSFKTRWGAHRAVWDGQIDGTPAPAGTYLVGLDVTDAACDTGRFPRLKPPAPGSTDHAGISVRYLAAEPPLTPVPAGSRALIYVDARRAPYSWKLWREGARKPSGHGGQRSFELRLKLPPAQDAGLYHLVITSGSHRTDIPLLADHPSRRHLPRVLVVLPALTWQGQNPVDDAPAYDGIPNTLDLGGPIALDRVFANGLPKGFTDEAAFLSYLDRAHLSYDLQSDLGLTEGIGPKLAGHAAVVLPGSERWIPPSLAGALREYVSGGGNLLSLGVSSLLRRVTIRGATAADPTPPAANDALGARPGPLVAHNSALTTQLQDGLGIFVGTSGVFAGYRAFQPIAVAAPAQLLSAAGTSASQMSIVGYRLGRGSVVEIGLVGFGSSLARNVDARDLVDRLWKVLGR